MASVVGGVVRPGAVLFWRRGCKLAKHYSLFLLYYNSRMLCAHRLYGRFSVLVMTVHIATPLFEEKRTLRK